MTPDALQAVMEASWPAASVTRVGPWAIRDGAGGGKRVSAATAAGDWQERDIAQAETAMTDLGQSKLFLIRQADQELDAALHARGYRVIDPVLAYAVVTSRLTETPPERMSSFPHWPPMAVAAQLWAEGGIGPARLAVMQRVTAPKTAILGRAGDRASGVAFVAVHQNIAMLHALEVTPALRRQGTAHNILRSAAQWAQDNGADTLSLVVTKSNKPACGLYASLGMSVVGEYHYREK